MRFQDVTRFEFRQFDKDLVRFKDIFGGLGRPAAQAPSREVYIVTRLNIEANVKIRADQLEVKALIGRLRMLEQWQPILKLVFPVPAEEIENVVAPALGIDVDLGDAPPLSEPALLKLAADQPALAVVVVDKHRTLFELEDCEAEFTELHIGEEAQQTIAVEGAEARAVEALLLRVGLEAAQNESYSLFLQRRLFSAAR